MTRKRFYQNLDNLKKKFGITDKDLAEMIGVSEEYYFARIKNYGKEKPLFQKILEILYLNNYY